MCELACSLAKEGEINPSLSRIRLREERFKGYWIPIVCVNCSNPPCISNCKTKALVKDTVTGWVELIREKCIDCALCIPHCPFGALHLTPSGKVILCDLCEGNPECIEFCATKAITYQKRDEPRGRTLMWSVSTEMDKPRQKIRPRKSKKR
jgi:Fe-S-cluster-containing hydrogenase component 2